MHHLCERHSVLHVVVARLNMVLNMYNHLRVKLDKVLHQNNHLTAFLACVYMCVYMCVCQFIHSRLLVVLPALPLQCVALVLPALVRAVSLSARFTTTALRSSWRR